MAGGTAAPRGRAALPSPADALFLMLALLVPALAGGRLVGSDGDAAAHVRLGQWMLEARGLVRTSLFAFTNEGEPFLAFAWGAEIVYAAAHGVGGFAAVALLAGCLIGATYALLYRFLRRQGVEPLLALAAVLLGAFCGSPHWLARPHLFTLLGVVLLLGLLERPGRRSLVLVALLFAVWANLHGGFLYGLILIALYAAGDAAELWLGRRGADGAAWGARLRYHASALGVAVLGTLLNPHGPALLAHVAGFLGEGFILDAIEEYRSPDFHEAYALPFLAGLLLAMAGLALRRGRPPLPWLAVILVTAAFALYAARNMALFGVAAVPAAALALDADWRRSGWLPRARRALAYGDAGGRLGPWSAAGLLLLLLLAWRGGEVAGRRVVADELDPGRFPVAAVAAAREAGLEGRIFNAYVWGGYMVYAWPEQRVFIDGVTAHYGAALTADYLRVIGLDAGWREVLDRWRIDHALLPAGSRLAAQLALEPGWRPWYCDSVAVILTRAAMPPPPPASPTCARPAK